MKVISIFNHKAPSRTPTMTVGIPRGLVYYEFEGLWERFFSVLGYDIELSRDTDREILDMGVKHCSNETCLPVKLFHGHALSLAGRADAVFVPRYASIRKNEFGCPKFCAAPDMIRHNLRGAVKVIEVKVDMNKGFGPIQQSLKALGYELGRDYNEILDAFRASVSEVAARMGTAKPKCRKRPSIAVLGHSYMVRDAFASMGLIAKLGAQGYQVLTADDLDYKEKHANSGQFVRKPFWSVGYENIGSAKVFSQSYNLKGAVYLTPFACGIDSVVAEFAQKQIREANIPFLKLTVDEHTGEAGFDTRLEAFLDMIG